MIQRTLMKKLLDTARHYPVVSLTGPRQSGKTTLARNAFSDYAYASLEAPDLRAFALEDPRGFLNQFSDSGVILDEVQRAPELFSYIQGIVDERDAPGLYILTGSQNFLLLEQIGQSLAGRAALLRLLPFSQAELDSCGTMGLDAIGVQCPVVNSPPTRDLFQCLFTGFYPRIHDKNLDASEWLGNYYQSYIERDMRSLVNIGNLEVFSRFVRLCAGRSGQLLNFAGLAGDCGVSHETARRWISILEASYIVYLLRPHHRNFSKRLVKSPKLYFHDTGLLCYLLGIRAPEELRLHPLRGAVFETFVLNELLKNAWNKGEMPEIYFWRDSSGHEIDFLIERGSSCTLIEVKSGETIASDYFSTMEYWRKIASDELFFKTALVYGGDTCMERRGTVVYSWRGWLKTHNL